MKKITIDFETRSRANLKKIGAHEYSMDSSTIATCMGFKIVGNPKISLLDFYTMQKPWAKLSDNFRFNWTLWCQDPDFIFSAHNAFFEQSIYKNVLVNRLRWPGIAPHKWRCTAAKAAAVAIPRNLADAGAVMKLTTQKDYEGHRVMMKLCKPTAAFTKWKKECDKFLNKDRDVPEEILESKPDEFWTPETAPEDYAILYKYCKIDVLTEEKLDESLPDLSPFEQKLWLLDQKINLRGVAVDMPAVDKIASVMKSESKVLGKELDILTMGLVSSGNARDAILDFLTLEGLELPDLKAKTVDDFLANGKATGDAKILLEIRRALSKASTAKYQKFQGCAASDGRVRDLFLYCAASTKRWGGKNVQPQNFPRGIIKDIDEAIHRIKTCSLEDLKMLYGENLMPLFSSVLRGMFIASPGKELFVEDLNAIETRVLWWLADHKEGLKIFYDGRDPYREMAAKIFKISILEVTEEQRQVGKAAVLGCLAKGTKILTNSGFKNIEDIQKTDLVWNGDEWQKHEGLLARGPKTVIKLRSLNLELTSDHWVLTSQGWRSAGEIALDEDTKPHQLVPEIKDAKLCPKNLKAALSAVSRCAAYVELLKNVESINFGPVEIYFAPDVRNLFAGKKVGDQAKKLCSYLTENLERVGLLVFTTLKKDVPILMIRTLKTTAVAEFETPSHPLEIFWNTLLRSMGLTNLDSRWTELTTMDTMSPEIYESSLKKLTTRIEETFDLKNVQNGNRYQAGFSIVHNCGYQMGGKKFVTSAWDVYRAKVTLDMAKVAVSVYREVHWPVTEFWENCQSACIFAIENPGRKYRVGKLRFFVEKSFLWIELPGGGRIAYKDPSVTWEQVEIKDDDGKVVNTFSAKKIRYYAVNQKAKKIDCVIPKWSREATYGGKIVENIVQSVSRNVLAEIMLNAEESGFEVLMHSHDELVSEAPKGKFKKEKDSKGNLFSPGYREIMERIPPWGEGLPLKASGWVGERYRKG